MGFKIKAQTQKKDDCGLQPFPSSEIRLTPSEMNRSLVAVARRVLSLHSTPSSSHCRFYCSSSSSPSNNKLFVGGLSWSVNEKTLKDAFDSYGDVTEVRILYDKETGRSRGFGFVYFSKQDDARSAKDAMDGKAFLGRPLRISFALDKVRGAPVVVPRLSNLVDAANRNK